MKSGITLIQKEELHSNHPGADIPKGTLRAIIKKSGYSVEEFI